METTCPEVRRKSGFAYSHNVTLSADTNIAEGFWCSRCKHVYTVYKPTRQLKNNIHRLRSNALQCSFSSRYVFCVKPTNLTQICLFLNICAKQTGRVCLTSCHNHKMPYYGLSCSKWTRSNRKLIVWSRSHSSTSS